MMEKDGTVMKGCHVDENDHIVCDICGTTKLSQGGHMDGSKDFTNYFTCENGHRMSVTCQREKNDLMRQIFEESPIFKLNQMHCPRCGAINENLQLTDMADMVECVDCHRRMYIRVINEQHWEIIMDLDPDETI